MQSLQCLVNYRFNNPVSTSIYLKKWQALKVNRNLSIYWKKIAPISSLYIYFFSFTRSTDFAPNQLKYHLQQIYKKFRLSASSEKEKQSSNENSKN